MLGTTGTTGPTIGDPRLSFVPSTSNFPQMPSHHPMAPMGMVGPSHPPPGAPAPTTQSTWQQTGTGTGTGQEKRGTSGVLVAGLGVLTGLALLGVAGGGAWYFVIRKDASPTNGATTVAVADGGVPATPASAAATTVQPVPGPTTTTTAKKPGKDGGAPAPGPNAKDGGAPAPGPGPAPGPAPSPTPNPDKEEQERNASLGRQAEANCRNHTMQMTTFARDDASRKRAAEQAKMFTCKSFSPFTARCEREVCKNACMVLGDNQCIQQIQYLIDHGPPPKY